MDAYLAACDPEQVCATDLQETMREENQDWKCYRIFSDQSAERGWLIYADYRAGIAWGGDATWTDCDGTPEDALIRYLTGNMSP